MELENQILLTQIHPSSTTQSLPREIVLVILEALVARTVADDSYITFHVFFQEDPKTRAKFDVVVGGLSCGHDGSQALRRSLIRAPLLINRFTHALTRQHYLPYPMTDDVPTRLIRGWVCPELDLFNFRIDQHFERLAVNDAPGLWLDNSPGRPHATSLQRAVEHPTPHDAEFVKGMQIVYKEYSGTFHRSGKAELQLIFSLPNLREFHIQLGALEREQGVIEPPRPPHSHSGLQPIDPALYPNFAYFTWDKEILDACARRAQERGIKIFCIDDRVGFFMYEKRTELLRTPEGLRMRYLHPECTCYDGPYWVDSEEEGPKWATDDEVEDKVDNFEEDVGDSEEDVDDSDDHEA